MHWENKAEERSIIIDAFQMLFSNFHININPCNNWSIAPIIQISNTEIKPVDPSETKRLESQATLKGSWWCTSIIANTAIRTRVNRC
jgi:hypothetical protein